MTTLGTFTKQPADELDYDIDYSEWLTAQDNVQSANVSVTPDDGSLLIRDPVIINDPRIKLWVSGGVSGTRYRIEVTMVTADGRTKQDEFNLRVKEH